MVASPQPMDLLSRLVRAEQAIKTLTSRVTSLPRIPVQVFPKWNSASQTATAAAYATVAASSAVTMGSLWEGRIDFGSHPCISIYGAWGDADSSALVVYQLSVGVSTFTWPVVTAGTSKHLFDISGLLTQEDIQVTLSVQSITGGTGTDHILVQPIGVFLRATPTDGNFG